MAAEYLQLGVHRGEAADAAAVLVAVDSAEEALGIASYDIFDQRAIFLFDPFDELIVGWLLVAELPSNMSKINSGDDAHRARLRRQFGAQGRDKRADPRIFAGHAPSRHHFMKR